MSIPTEALLFVPLGGTGEIGMNLNVYGVGGTWLAVDMGVSFADDATPGLDAYMADPAFIAERRDDLAGIVVTHGHEDHLGAIAHLWPRLRCPVYASPFAAALLRGKLAEANLLGEVDLHEIPLSGRAAIGPFEVELVGQTHSIPEANSLAIHTAFGTVLHTGDWKFDPDPLIGAVADKDRLKSLGDEGVLALIGDSTNVFNPGRSGSEAEVRTSLTELLGRYRPSSSVRLVRTSASDPERPGLKTLVESPISARTPSSPRLFKRSLSATAPIRGSGSNFQSPVCKTVPKAVWMASELASGMEWV